MAGYLSVQSLPRRVMIRTLPRSSRACIRYPSNLISCSQSGPSGAFSTSLASCGLIQAGGEASSVRRRVGIVADIGVAACWSFKFKGRRPVERGKDRLKAFFDRAPHFGVREHVKFIITNSGHDSSRHFRRVHASADPFSKSSVKRVRRVHWCRWAITLVAIASALQDVGADDSRTQDAHADAERLHLHGESLGHADDGILGCRIGREALPPAWRE